MNSVCTSWSDKQTNSNLNEIKKNVSNVRNTPVATSRNNLNQMLLVKSIALQHNLKIKTDTFSTDSKEQYSFSILYNQRHDRLGIHIKITRMCKNRLCYQSAFLFKFSFEWTVSWGNWVYWMFIISLVHWRNENTNFVLIKTFIFAIIDEINIATNRYFVNEIQKKSNKNIRRLPVFRPNIKKYNETEMHKKGQNLPASRKKNHGKLLTIQLQWNVNVVIPNVTHIAKTHGDFIFCFYNPEKA